MQVLLSIITHITVTGIVVFMFYWHVYRVKNELEEKELNERMFQVSLVTVLIFIIILVIGIILK